MGVLDRGDVLREKQAVSRRGARIRAWMGRRLLMEGGQDGRLHVRGRSHRGSMDDICTLAAKRFTQRREKPERCVITYSGCPERAKELGKKLKKLCGFRHHDGGILIEEMKRESACTNASDSRSLLLCGKVTAVLQNYLNATIQIRKGQLRRGGIHRLVG